LNLTISETIWSTIIDDVTFAELTPEMYGIIPDPVRRFERF
jgi:hypothetical protein